MTELSRRISAVQPSPTLALNSKVQELKKQGIPVLSFAVGEPDFPTPAVVVEKAIESLRQGRTRYGAAGGGPALREALARKLKKDNRLDFKADQIVLGIGAKEILFHTFLSLLNEGDEVLIPAPYWVSYADQVIAAGGTPIVVPAPQNFPNPPIDLADLDRYATSRTKAIIFNSPNNPAGYVFAPEFVKELGEYLSKKSWWVISDEIYEYLAFTKPHVSLLEAAPSLKDRFVLINGFSKSFSMTGWRVGYAAGPSNIIGLIRSLQSQSSTCLPMFIEDAAVVAAEAGRDLVQASIEDLDRRRKVASALLKTVPWLRLMEPEGAFYLWCDVRPALRPGESTVEFCARLLDSVQVAAVPGEAFGMPGFMRMSFAVSEVQLREGVERLNRLV